MSTEQVAIPPTEDTPVGAVPLKGSEGGVTNPRNQLIVRVIVLVLIAIWLIPTIGLLITSLRTQGAIDTSGWWTVFASLFDTSQWTLQNYREVLTSGGFDSAFVNCATPPLAAAYAGTFNPPWKDTKDAILCHVSATFSDTLDQILTFMIEPRCGPSLVIIWAPTSRHSVNTVFKLTWSTCV